jgi:hypothetical protein
LAFRLSSVIARRRLLRLCRAFGLSLAFTEAASVLGEILNREISEEITTDEDLHELLDRLPSLSNL